MTAQAVLERVEQEINGQWEQPTSHAMDQRQAVLRPPRLVTAQVWSAGGNKPRDVWLVMVERPESESGYWVFFDPEDDCFGLATRTPDGDFFYVGAYGTLWDTLQGM